MFFGIDYYYIYFVIPPLIISIIAQINIKKTFNKYNSFKTTKRYTAEQVARIILDKNGLHNVNIEHVSGHLTDHFDPRTNTIRLSDINYYSDSVSSIGIAAHEVGHAIQYSKGYFPIKIRNTIIPITQLGSNLAFPLAILGIIMSFKPLITIGIVLFLFVMFFQLITLPVEFNASRRAIESLSNFNIMDQTELNATKKVLYAAAMTYVAALLVAIGNLIRLLLLANRNNR